MKRILPACNQQQRDEKGIRIFMVLPGLSAGALAASEPSPQPGRRGGLMTATQIAAISAVAMGRRQLAARD